MTQRGTVLRSVHAGAPGIIIPITADPASAKAALEIIEKKLLDTERAGNRFGQTMGQSSTALEHGIPKMAAASAGLRALEGNFTNNIRAGERFLTMIPGISGLLETAFPAIGLVVLSTALVKAGEEAYHFYQNVVLLKGSIESLNSLDITVGKKVQQAADQAESSMERVIEATQGKAAALKQKLAYQSGKGIDLSDYFYSKEYKDLPTNVKADYESSYKAIAPSDIPDRLSKITTEIKALKKEMANPGEGSTLGGFGSRVGVFGPSALESNASYYAARLKAATQIKQLLEADTTARSGKLQEIGVEGDKDAKPKAAVSDNPIAQAATALQQAQAKQIADATRASDQAELAEIEAHHKLMLLSDADYYQKKFDLADAGFTARQNAINKETAELQALQERQRNDKLLRRDKDGNSKEEYETAQKLVALKREQANLDAEEHEAASRLSEEVGTSSAAAEIASLRVAAQLEQERNGGIAARIALIQREHEIEAQKSTLHGGSEADAQAIRDAGALAVQKLQLQQIEQNIARVEQEHRRAIDDTNDAVAKGDLSKRSAAQQTRAANAQELQDLHTLADQYRALAEAIGDPVLLGKAKDLDATLANLGRTDRRGTFGKEIQDGLQGITTSIIDSAARGKQSFADMAKSILDDLNKVALKMAEEKFILPLFEQAFGGGKQGSGPGGAGGAPTGNGGGFGAAFGLPSFTGFSDLVGGGPAPGAGGGGPSIYRPEQKQGGGLGASLLNSFIGVAGKLATSAIKSKQDDGDDDDDSSAPASTVNIHNHGSQPVGGATSTTSWNSDLRQFIIDVVLQDKMEGGQLSQV